MTNKSKVFLDLDSTLVRTFYPQEIVKNRVLSGRAVPINDRQVTVPRPGLPEFLEGIKTLAEPVVFTSADASYAEEVTKALGLDLSVRSSKTERPQSLEKEYDLNETRWVLVDDTPRDHPLTVYKFQCLGLTHGKEFSLPIVSRRFVLCKGYHPRTEPQNDHDLVRVLTEIKDKLRKSMF